MVSTNDATAIEFAAFRAEPVVENFSRSISSLCLWGDQVIAGLQDGSLLFFQRVIDEAQDRSLAGNNNSQVAWQVVKTHKDVERKAVLQMVVAHLPTSGFTGSPTTSSAKLAAEARQATQQSQDAPLSPQRTPNPNSKPFLLSLTQDGINVRSLPDGMLRLQADRCKGASCFSWSNPRLQLAVSVKRRTLLMSLRMRERAGGAQASGVELQELCDIAAPDLIHTMMWAGNSLFLGSKKAYHLAHASLESITRPSSQGGAPPAAAAAAAPPPLMLQPGDVCAVGPTSGPAMALSASGEEVLLVREAAVVCVDMKGQPTRRLPLTFSEPLVGIAVGAHYVIGLTTNSLEVLSLRRGGDGGVLQCMPTLSARLVAAPGAAPDGSLYLGLNNDQGVCRLMPVPLGEQADTLARVGQYSEALALAALLEDKEGGASQRTQVEDRLRLLYAHHLYATGEYEEGMAQLALCSSHVSGAAAVLVLLRMIPTLVPLNMRSWLPDVVAGAALPQVAEPEGASYALAASLILPYLTSYRSRTMSAYPELVTARNEMTRASSSSIAGGDGATSKQGSQPGEGRASDASATPAVQPVVGSGGDEAGQEQGGGSSEVLPDPHTLLVLVDTAMVAGMLCQPEDVGSLLRFVQQAPHWIDLQEGERLLKAAGRYAELVALYKYHGLHQQALDTLHRCSQDPQHMTPPPTGAAADLGGLPGVWAAVRYLTHLGTQHADLIRQHSGWILGADPEAGLQAFLQMRQPLEPSLALDILHTHSPEYSGMYLESALELGVAAPQDYHTELLLIYLQEILNQGDQDSSSTASSVDLQQDQAAVQAPSTTTTTTTQTGPSPSPAHHHSKSTPAANLTSVTAKETAKVTGGGGGDAAATVADVERQGVLKQKAVRRRKHRRSGSDTWVGPGLRLGLLDPEQPGLVGSPPKAGPLPIFPDFSARSKPVPVRGSAGAATAGARQIKASGSLPHRRSLTGSSGAASSGDSSEGERQEHTTRRARPALKPTRSGHALAPTDESPAACPDVSPAHARHASAPASTLDPAEFAQGSQAGSKLDADAASRLPVAKRRPLYQRLRDLVFTSPYLDPEHVLSKLPPGELPEIRALMLERLGQHKEALQVYCSSLQRLDLAEAYCDRVYTAELSQRAGGPTSGAAPHSNGTGTGGGAHPSPAVSQPQYLTSPGVAPPEPLTLPEDIYMLLLQVVLDSPEFQQCSFALSLANEANGVQVQQQERQGGGEVHEPPACWTELCWMLARKVSRLDAQRVLAAVPQIMPLAWLMPVVSAALSHVVEVKRRTAVERQLRRSENLTLKEVVGAERGVRLVLAPERTCCICYKRLGLAVFVAYPNLTLAHYQCHKRRFPDEATHFLKPALTYPLVALQPAMTNASAGQPGRQDGLKGAGGTGQHAWQQQQQQQLLGAPSPNLGNHGWAHETAAPPQPFSSSGGFDNAGAGLSKGSKGNTSATWEGEVGWGPASALPVSRAPYDPVQVEAAARTGVVGSSAASGSYAGSVSLAAEVDQEEHVEPPKPQLAVPPSLLM